MTWNQPLKVTVTLTLPVHTAVSASWVAANTEVSGSARPFVLSASLSPWTPVHNKEVPHFRL